MEFLKGMLLRDDGVSADLTIHTNLNGAFQRFNIGDDVPAVVAGLRALADFLEREADDRVKHPYPGGPWL